jgi:glutathione S-transferase
MSERPSPLPVRLYDSTVTSGNGYKVRLLLHHLAIECKRVTLDIFGGATRTPEFLAKNANGRIPLLELDDGTFLPESNAILCYLAEGTEYLPSTRLDRARALSWMFFEQYSHEPYIAVLRAWKKYGGGLAKRTPQELEAKTRGSYAALDVLERTLASRPFLVGNRYSIADIALYAYTHVAADADLDLGRYPAIRGWLDRVREQPRFVAMTND